MSGIVDFRLSILDFRFRRRSLIIHSPQSINPLISHFSSLISAKPLYHPPAKAGPLLSRRGASQPHFPVILFSRYVDIFRGNGEKKASAAQSARAERKAKKASKEDDSGGSRPMERFKELKARRAKVPAAAQRRSLCARFLLCRGISRDRA
jgi:hypothetical protein